MFKGMPIMPADLLSLRTAGAIAAGYEYVLTPNVVVTLCAVGVCAYVLSFVKPNRGEFSLKVHIAASFASVVVGVSLVGVMAGMFNNVKLEDTLEVAFDRWMPITLYQTLGFVPAFIEVAQDFSIPFPKGVTGRAPRRKWMPLRPSSTKRWAQPPAGRPPQHNLARSNPP